MAFNLKAVLETEVIDKLLVVMKAHDQDLEAKIAKMGTNIGSADTWADRPSVDQNGKAVTVGDVFTLTTKDDTHPAGKYERKGDNSDWNDTPFIDFDNINITKIIEDAKADPDAIVVGEDGVITATEDGKFVTPKQIKDALTSLNTANANKFHPKGGDQDLKVIGKDADENTQEFVTANQLAATFTQEEVNTKYDNL